MPADPRTPRARAGRPAVTSRAEVVAAARRLVERDGWERLTVRRLAAELGVGTTTLYHHVRDREDVLVELLGDVAARAPRPGLPADPRGRVLVAARALRDLLADLPWAAEVLTVDGFVGRLPDAALWPVEAVLAGAVAHGCTPDEAVGVFRSVWYYTVGEVLVRRRSTGAPGLDVGALRDREQLRFDRRDPELLPHLAAVADRWPELAARDTYDEGLAALVDGLLARAAARP